MNHVPQLVRWLKGQSEIIIANYSFRTLIYIIWMVSPCIHSYDYEFESRYIFPAPSLFCLLKQEAKALVHFSEIPDCPFKRTGERQGQAKLEGQ